MTPIYVAENELDAQLVQDLLVSAGIAAHIFGPNVADPDGGVPATRQVRVVVEDEEAITVLLRYNLESEGYVVDACARGEIEADAIGPLEPESLHHLVEVDHRPALDAAGMPESEISLSGLAAAAAGVLGHEQEVFQGEVWWSAITGPRAVAEERYAAYLAWVARHGLTPAQYQAAFDQFTRQGYRLSVVSGYRDGGSDRYAAVWTKAGGPQWSARHGTPAAHYQSVFDNHRYQSWEPDYVEAFNGQDGVRFNTIWRNTTFAAKDLKLIEDKARAYMRANDIPGLSIAVMRNDKLVYAAGFGVADKDSGMPVSPRHRFRIASVSKPITHVAVVNLANTTSLELGDRVFGDNSILGGTFATPDSNPDIEDITVDHLIRHRAGFRRINADGANSDPMFDYSGTGHAGLINWALEEYPLGYTPGTAPANLTGQDRYSNFGYCLLGRVIEARSGKSYEAYVRDTLLKPAGAGDIVIGGDKLADRKPDEVVYYGSGAYSSVKPQRFDSHGGWIARPIDLLRFMRHTDDILAPYYHNGAMSGTLATYDQRAGGFGLVAVSNSRGGSPDDMKAMMDAIADEVSNWPAIDLF